MYPKLLHIYGPFFIQSYGFCIALGLLIFGWLLFKDHKRIRLVDDDSFHKLLIIGIVSGILGGRILFFATNGSWTSLWDFFQFWYGGFAVLGSIVAVLAVIPPLLKKQNIPILPLLDRVALYTPLLQAISRIGCFLSGCCYGKPSLIAWAVTYSNHECMAPLGVALHPTQLYSALILACIFSFLIFFQHFFGKNGQLLASYLVLASAERFIVDFFRDDQTYNLSPVFLCSDHQLIALIMSIGGCALFFYSSYSKSTVARVP